MDQYEKGGPKVEPKSREHDYLTMIRSLERKVENQAQHIKDLDAELRKIRNDLRMAITAINNSRNGKT